MTTPTPMTAERLHALLNSSMVGYIASRSTEDWVALGESHPAAIVREMAVKILMQERELAAAKERALAAEARVEAMAEELHSWERTFCSSGEFSPALRDYRAAQEKP